MAKIDDKTETYVLVKGKHAGIDAETGERGILKVGAKVELTRTQAESFSGKFKSLKQVRAEAKMHAEDEDEKLDSQTQPVAPTEPVAPVTPVKPVTPTK